MSLFSKLLRRRKAASATGLAGVRNTSTPPARDPAAAGHAPKAGGNSASALTRRASFTALLTEGEGMLLSAGRVDFVSTDEEVKLCLKAMADLWEEGIYLEVRRLAERVEHLARLRQLAAMEREGVTQHD